MSKTCNACGGAVCEVCGGCISHGECSCIEDQIQDLRTKYEDAIGVLENTRERLRHAEEILLKVRNWAYAYPLDVFPEPDIAKCELLLKAGGQSIDTLAAYARRGAIEWIKHDVCSYWTAHKSHQKEDK